jgi:hypothetical protein
MFPEGKKIICCFVGGFLAGRSFVGFCWCFVVAGLEEVSGQGRKKNGVPAKENTGEKKNNKKNKNKKLKLEKPFFFFF